MLTSFVLVFNLLFGSSVPAVSQKSSTFDVIARSIPNCERNWKEAEEPWRSDHIPVPQASIVWTNGSDDVTAYIFLFADGKTAAVNLKADRDDEPNLILKGIGDEAYLWSPTTNSRYDRYTIRFRKAGVLVLLSSRSEEVTRNSAKCIAGAIRPLEKD